MTATVTGTVGTLRRLFERGEVSKSQVFSSNFEVSYNGISSTSNGSGVTNSNSKTEEKPNLNGPSPTNFSLADKKIISQTCLIDRIPMNQTSVELGTKPPPPKVKPKPIMYRKIIPALRTEPLTKPRLSLQNLQQDSCSVTESLSSQIDQDSISADLIGSESSPAISPPDMYSFDHNVPINEEISPSTGSEKSRGNEFIPAHLMMTKASVKVSKEPPPVSKKPRSVLSGYSNSLPVVQPKYDKVLKEQFGLTIDQSSYEFTQRWANEQAQLVEQMGLNTGKKPGQNETAVQISRTPSVSSSTGLSSLNFTNSSIRSILKKERPPLGFEKKRLTFKGDDELLTFYNYPSDESYDDDDDDSLNRFHSALHSDSDSSSTFDGSQDYEIDVVGSVSTLRSSSARVSGSRIIFAGSTISTSTLKGSVSYQRKPRLSSQSPQRTTHSRTSTSGSSNLTHHQQAHQISRSSSSNRDNAVMSSRRTNFNHYPSTWSTAFASQPNVLTPTKGGTYKRFSNEQIRFHY